MAYREARGQAVVVTTDLSFPAAGFGDGVRNDFYDRIRDAAGTWDLHLGLMGISIRMTYHKFVTIYDVSVRYEDIASLGSNSKTFRTASERCHPRLLLFRYFGVHCEAG
jgi:hypothetical protein